MNVREIMSTPAVSCRQEDTLNTAAQLMWETDCGAIPVVGDDGQLVGIITDRDICMAAYTQGKCLPDILVSQVMSRVVYSCRAEDALDVAEHLMSDKQIRRLPVVDGDSRPIGILSLGDVARRAASQRKKNGVEREVAQTLAAICEPRQSGQVAAAPGDQGR
jgi:CBS domain-containing protein